MPQLDAVLVSRTSINADPSWEPLLGTPPHPDYPSGHNIYSGAMAEVIRRLIGGDQLSFATALVLPTGPLPRSWTSLSEAEKDVMGARIWAGIHFLKVPSKDTATVVAALGKHVRKLPQQLRRSLTWDRGKEMAD